MGLTNSTKRCSFIVGGVKILLSVSGPPRMAVFVCPESARAPAPVRRKADDGGRPVPARIGACLTAGFEPPAIRRAVKSPLLGAINRHSEGFSMASTSIAALRKRLEANIEQAIDALNRLDGDPDLEAEEDACEFEDADGLQSGVPLFSDCEDYEFSAAEVLDQRKWSGAGASSS